MPNETLLFYFKSLQRVQSVLLLFGRREFALIQQGQAEDKANVMFVQVPSHTWAALDGCRKLHPIDLNYARIHHTHTHTHMPQTASPQFTSLFWAAPTHLWDENFPPGVRELPATLDNDSGAATPPMPMRELQVCGEVKSRIYCNRYVLTIPCTENSAPTFIRSLCCVSLQSVWVPDPSVLYSISSGTQSRTGCLWSSNV